MTIGRLRDSLRKTFADSSDSPDADAREILSCFLGLSPAQMMLRADDEVPDGTAALIRNAEQRRLNGEPVAYITGERGFYRSVFKVSPETLIPRADTETLVENAATEIAELRRRNEEVRILDLCCGTGCIGISVAKELAPKFNAVHLTLADVSEGALKVCKENVRRLINETNIRISVVESNLFESMDETVFDAILSNPPYISSSVIPTLERQVQFEPVLALDGGEDGLHFVRRIAESAKTHLAVGGLLEMEIGSDQAVEASAILRRLGYSEIAVLKDLGGNDRLVKGRN